MFYMLKYNKNTLDKFSKCFVTSHFTFVKIKPLPYHLIFVTLIMDNPSLIFFIKIKS